VARLAAQGIRVESFNSEESAADVDDLRQALGKERINVYGQSYGTLLAQTVARRFPAGVRTLLLEATTAVAHDALLTSSARSFELVAARILEECAASPDCSRDFPTLADDFAAILTTLPPGSDESVGVLKAMELLMQFADGTSYVPLLLRAILTNDLPTVERLAAIVQAISERVAQATAGFSTTMLLAVNCYDYAPLLTEAREQELLGEVPEALRAAFPSGLALAATCAQLPPGYVSPEQRQPLKSDLPTLLLAGSHDTNTPLEVAELVAADLTNGHLVVRPGWGHVMLVLGDTCSLQTYADFLREPMRRPTTACLATAQTTFATAAP
jgi:pimeloyl-ACP methyl ester carboxylesterase